MFDNMFNGVIGKIQKGCCRLSMNGKIAIKTSDGYKVYNEKTGNLTNCSNFVLDIADDTQTRLCRVLWLLILQKVQTSFCVHG